MISIRPIAPHQATLDVFATSPRRSLDVGEDLYHADDVATSIYIVEHGTIVETRSEGNGRSFAVAIHGPGTVFGYRTLAKSPRRGSRATALVTTVLREMDRHVALELLALDPEFASKMMTDLAKAARQAERMCDAWQWQDLRSTLLFVLREIVNNLEDHNGNYSYRIDLPLLELMTGCPAPILGKTLQSLQTNGSIQPNDDGYQFVNRQGESP